MVIIRGHHLAICVQEMELLPLAIVMVTANGIGELVNVFPTGNAQMKNVFVEQTRIAILMRNPTATRTRTVKKMNNVQREIVFQHVLYCPVDVMPIVYQKIIK